MKGVKSKSDDTAFLFSCIQNSATGLRGIGQIDWDKVAQDNGYGNRKSASNRFNQLCKNFETESGTTDTKTTPTKKSAAADNNEDDNDKDVKPEKKKRGRQSKGEGESPAKKKKGANAVTKEGELSDCGVLSGEE
ncbi:hypothetical protein EX30DRAFT_337347 [Ascodesmis nigricans]|uniref:Myb-like DNA-binding domain-containing protein n=1 Tax=Ascodesmis nigricans TaxID=341454 RepID=A0A4S2N6I7_9PEZI|nr:hypothetical protein EX30DRAFT_337347 [Ascodesmis nigricans]